MTHTHFSSVTSLTVWSSRRPQAPLAGALRAAHSGAAYRGRYAPIMKNQQYLQNLKG